LQKAQIDEVKIEGRKMKGRSQKRNA
jgi:hypothetical protein